VRRSQFASIPRKRDGNCMKALVKVSVFTCSLLTAVITYFFLTVPRANIDDTGSVDVLLVLGSPTSIRGSLTQEEAWRVREAVLEFRRGRASHVIFSGGPAANKFIEADTMAAFAMQLGLPRNSIEMERASMTTLENLRNSSDVMRTRGWNSVEIISTSDHLRRVAALLQGTTLRWRGHSAPSPGRTILRNAIEFAEEAVATSLIRCFGTRSESFVHGVAQIVYEITFCLWKLKSIFATGTHASNSIGSAGLYRPSVKEKYPKCRTLALKNNSKPLISRSVQTVSNG